MSRMPGPGTGAAAIVIGSASCGGGGADGEDKLARARRRQFGGGERHGVAAQGQQPIQRPPKLLAKLLKTRIGRRYEPVDLDQRIGRLVMVAGRHKRTAEAKPRQYREHPAAADVRRVFGGEQGAIVAGFPLCTAPNRERIAAVATGVAATAERQAGDNPRRLVISRQQMPPPRVGRSLLLGHGYYAD